METWRVPITTTLYITNTIWSVHLVLGGGTKKQPFEVFWNNFIFRRSYPLFHLKCNRITDFCLRDWNVHNMYNLNNLLFRYAGILSILKIFAICNSSYWNRDKVTLRRKRKRRGGFLKNKIREWLHFRNTSKKKKENNKNKQTKCWKAYRERETRCDMLLIKPQQCVFSLTFITFFFVPSIALFHSMKSGKRKRTKQKYSQIHISALLFTTIINTHTLMYLSDCFWYFWAVDDETLH